MKPLYLVSPLPDKNINTVALVTTMFEWSSYHMGLVGIPTTKPEVGNRRWRPLNVKYIYFSF